MNSVVGLDDLHWSFNLHSLNIGHLSCLPLTSRTINWQIQKRAWLLVNLPSFFIFSPSAARLELLLTLYSPFFVATTSATTTALKTIPASVLMFSFLRVINKKKDVTVWMDVLWRWGTRALVSFFLRTTWKRTPRGLLPLVLIVCRSIPRTQDVCFTSQTFVYQHVIIKGLRNEANIPVRMTG